MKSKTIAIAAVTTAISLGTVGVASASTTTKATTVAKTVVHNVADPSKPNPITSVLSTLVANGTITAAQSTAIANALAAARPVEPKPMASGAPSVGPSGQGGPRGGFGFVRNIMQQEQSVILSTLGITAATLQSDLQAGKSLATIAGTKTQTLISALVAAETTAINAEVTAGKITSAQATTLISGLTARITTQVNATPGKGFGGFGGHGGWGPAGAPSPAATSGTN